MADADGGSSSKMASADDDDGSSTSSTALPLQALEGESYASFAKRSLVSFKQEGEKLIAAHSKEAFSNGDIIYASPSTGAKLWVGSADLASDYAQLTAIGCRSIVYCQDEYEGSLYFIDEPGFRYLSFPIGTWLPPPSWPDVAPGDASPTTPTDEAMLAYVQPLFAFVETELAAGRNVLIHCLAGAHRAGTAGVACLMHLEGLDRVAATTMAQERRELIDPIHHLYYLLTQLETAMGRGDGSASASTTEAEYAHRIGTAR